MTFFRESSTLKSAMRITSSSIIARASSFNECFNTFIARTNTDFHTMSAQADQDLVLCNSVADRREFPLRKPNTPPNHHNHQCIQSET